MNISLLEGKISGSSELEIVNVMYTVSRKRKVEVQVACPFTKRRNNSTQVSKAKGGYGRNDNNKILTYDQFKD